MYIQYVLCTHAYVQYVQYDMSTNKLALFILKHLIVLLCVHSLL